MVGILLSFHRIWVLVQFSITSCSVSYGENTPCIAHTWAHDLINGVEQRVEPHIRRWQISRTRATQRTLQMPWDGRMIPLLNPHDKQNISPFHLRFDKNTIAYTWYRLSQKTTIFMQTNLRTPSVLASRIEGSSTFVPSSKQWIHKQVAFLSV